MENREQERVRGFIVHAFTRLREKNTQLCLTGRLATGETFAALSSREHPRFYVRSGDGDRARRLAADRSALPVHFTPCPLTTMDGEACLRIEAAAEPELNELARSLAAHSIRTYEADVRLPEAYLMDHTIHGSIALSGRWQRGQHVDRVYIDPEVTSASWEPALSIASVDIETNPFGPEIYAVATHFRSERGLLADTVILCAPGGGDAHPELDRSPEGIPFEKASARLIVVDSEEDLLRRWAEEIRHLDPDLITGWNVTAFDFARLAERFRHFGIPLLLGRSGETGTFLAAAPGKPATVVIPGRQVLDGLRIARAGPGRFPDHSLETVAQQVLGRGKSVTARGTRERLETLERMYRSEPLALCSYCLGDARLVLEILDATGLLELTLRRSLLIGIPLSRAWTSIAAFDFLYIEAMHRRGIVAPTPGVDALPIESAPGGAILSPVSGLFDNVLVFDFKSLYPSIIRTFNIDPLSYCGRSAGEDAELIHAPNGTAFRREPAILPTLIEGIFAGREEARRRNDKTAVYVYKILMNSFYGVLGASGCRFAGSDLAGAITAFGHAILHWCRDLLEEAGHHTLYGDTDSLFVEANLPRGADDAALRRRGEELRSLANTELAKHLRERYDVESHLDLEFEKLYLRLFIPPVRGQHPAQSSGGAQRGRAKGYAGYLGDSRRPDSTPAHDNGPEYRIEVRGMEAVRRDWTALARDFQLELLRMVFEEADGGRIGAYIRGYLARLRTGELDDKLVYTKALRKSVDRYAAGAPPHVQAARRLESLDQRGLISYVWTVAGPQPLIDVRDPIDYDHYVEKQLKPIAGSFSEVLRTNLSELFDADRQLPLF